jgi:2-oxo-4-hydroxy-4-carboxy-5-ureidoimidazoline decarboxylase
VTLADLNARDRRGFVEAIGWAFEHSPWVAEGAWAARPFTSLDDLHAKMTRVMHDADLETKLALLRAHPDLGARASMSESSTLEQRGAGLDRLSRADFERLQALNRAYRAKFAFPFLLAVKDSSVDQILEALEQRLGSGPDDELEEALRQVSRIARFRLETVLST